MGSGSWLLTCAGATGNGIDRNIAVDEAHLSSRQQTKLNASCKTTWVCHVLSYGYF